MASPLAAVAVCGGGRVCGRDKSLTYGLNRERDLAISCGPGMPGPYRAAMGKRDVAASWRAAYMRPLLWPRVRNPATPEFKVEEGSAALRTDSNTASV